MRSRDEAMIFKAVRDGKPYPDHGLTTRDWARIPPRQIRLDSLTTITTVLALDRLLSEDSTFFGDLFSHVVQWQGELYLEDGLHRAVRSALRDRPVIHARVLDLDSVDPTGLDDASAIPDGPELRPTGGFGGPPVSRPGGAHRRRDGGTGWTTHRG